MEPQGDPDDQIRNLERQYQPGHYQPGQYPLGPADQYSPPPLPPTYGYGDPYALQRSRSNTRALWIVVAIAVVLLLAVAGGIAAFVVSRGSQGSTAFSPNPGTSSPTPSTSRTPSSSRRSPAPSASRTPTATTGPSASPTAPPSSNIAISGVNETKTIVCLDNVVTISGVSNTITIGGHCASLTVSGMNNAVTVDSVDTIDASGLNNQVTYHSGSPQINKSGLQNVVQQG